MNPDDMNKITDGISDSNSLYYSANLQAHYDVVSTATIDIGNITFANSGNITWSANDVIDYGDTFFSHIATEDEELYVSQHQKDAHEGFPALKEAWDQYVLVYKLAKGREPGEEIL